jgi:uncharacterized protein YqhQ
MPERVALQSASQYGKLHLRCAPNVKYFTLIAAVVGYSTSSRPNKAGAGVSTMRTDQAIRGSTFGFVPGSGWSMSGDRRLDRNQKPLRFRMDFGIIVVVLFAVAGMVLSLVFASTLAQLLTP